VTILIIFYIFSVIISIGIAIEHIKEWNDSGVYINLSFGNIAFVTLIIIVIFIPVINLVCTKELMNLTM
jgi:hypothetical protein